MITLVGLLLAVTLGVVPMAVYALLLWWFDRYEKEPLGLLVAAFVWGAVPAVVFSLVAELALGVSMSQLVRPERASLVEAALIAPVAEEVFKGGALLLLFVFFRREVDSAIDGILYGGLVGFGFAAVENTLYFGSSLIEGGFGQFALVALFRAFLFGLNHALFTGLFGLGVAWSTSASSAAAKVGAPAVGLSLGMVAHATHNASVTLGGELGWPCLIAFTSNWVGVAFLVGVLVWCSLRERRWIDHWLGEEVDKGTLSEEDFNVVSSYVARLAERADALLAGDLNRWWRLGRYYRLATELAFSKRRLAGSPEDVVARERVERLRTQVERMAVKPSG
ncbi:MAG: PrsW family intramembrane metalloprotease [Anaerolineae bacterium]